MFNMFFGLNYGHFNSFSIRRVLMYVIFFLKSFNHGFLGQIGCFVG